MYCFVVFSVFVFIVDFDGGNAVLDGDLAEEGQFKYIVGIDILPDSRCVGAIIDETHILTAGHCLHGVEATDITIIAGATNVFDEAVVLRDVEEVHVHLGYKPATTYKVDRTGLLSHFQWLIGQKKKKEILQNDIGVLTLKTPLPLEGNIATVDLPASDVLPYGTECYFAGWGETERDDDGANYDLRYGQMKILTPQECKSRSTKHTDSQFCAINDNFCGYPFSGDSGSPLVYNNVVYGLVSTSRNTDVYPAIFTKVSSFKTFIEGVIENDRSKTSSQV